MLFGKDFDKIQWDFYGYHLLEPNVFIGDVLIFIFCMFCFFKITGQSRFFILWRYFFLLYALSFLMGGLGHLFFNYWGVLGKIPAWCLGIYIPFLIESAMMVIHPDQEFSKKWIHIFKLKYILFLVLEILLFIFISIDKNPVIGLILPVVCSIVGLLFCLGSLAYKYQKIYDSRFKYLYFGAFTMLLSAVAQGLKINIHPWFDKTDLSHVIILMALYLFFKTVKSKDLNVSNVVNQ